MQNPSGPMLRLFQENFLTSSTPQPPSVDVLISNQTVAWTKSFLECSPISWTEEHVLPESLPIEQEQPTLPPELPEQAWDNQNVGIFSSDLPQLTPDYAQQDSQQLAEFQQVTSNQAKAYQRPILRPKLQLLTLPEVGTPTCVSYDTTATLLHAFKKEVTKASRESSLDNMIFYVIYGEAAELFIDPDTLDVAIRIQGKKYRRLPKSIKEMKQLVDGGLPTQVEVEPQEESGWDFSGGVGF